MITRDQRAVLPLVERQRTVEHGGCPRFLIAADEQGWHIREVRQVNHVTRSVSVSGTPEVHYETRTIASGRTLTEAVDNARAANWTARP